MCIPQSVGSRPVLLVALAGGLLGLFWAGPLGLRGSIQCRAPLCGVPKGRVEARRDCLLPGTVAVPLYELIFFLDHRNQRSAISGITASVWSLLAVRTDGLNLL